MTQPKRKRRARREEAGFGRKPLVRKRVSSLRLKPREKVRAVKTKKHETMNQRDLGKLIKLCRKHMRMNTQNNLARFLGCSQSRISKMEAGKLDPSALELAKIVRRVLRLDIWKLIETKIGVHRE